MAVPVTLKKRLEALENRVDGRNEIKVFIHDIEKNPPFWKPEDPGAWQQLHPKGKAILLTMRDCGGQAG